jgi:hypothetical protein
VSQDPDVLREIVDRKAEELKRDLEEIGARVVTQPRAAIEQKVETVRRASSPLRAFAKKHPLVTAIGALAIGFAAGFVL